MKKFRNKFTRERVQQAFDKEKIFIHQKGKDINMYDFIQENREDTEFYPTLEKYGCIDKIIVNKKDLYTSFNKMMNLRDIQEQMQEAENLWNQMPLEIRKEFNHDKFQFMNEGEKWFKEQLNNQAKQESKPQAEIKTQEVTTNEQKHQ